jgi:signal transduction histidine kinase
VATTTEDVVAGVRSPALQGAVRRLLAGLSDYLTEHHLDGERLVDRLRLLLECIETPPSPDFSQSSAPDLLLLTRLLQGIRSQLLAAWTDGQHHTEMNELLHLLARIERVHEDVQVGTNRSPVLSMLTSLRGADLMVELAHDLRSPLTSILFLAETLRHGQSGYLNDIQHRQLGIIYSASLSVVSMAEDIIELARGGPGLLEREPAAFSLSQTFDSVFDLVRPMIDEKRIVLSKQIPDQDQRLGFPLTLSRVLLNLTTNAIKFTDSGFVELSAEPDDGDLLRISVTDSGRGISPESIPHLFEPFRTRPTRDGIGFSGSGLGLWICRRLVADMGGRLEFTTTPGLGTSFFFTIKARRPAAPL